MIAAALVGKRIILNKIDPKIVKKEIEILKKMGVKLKSNKTSIEILKSVEIKKINVETKPYPGFPTDLQAQLMVLMIKEKENQKLKKTFLKTDSCTYQSLKEWEQYRNKNKTAIISGPSKLTGAEVMATDLRASVSLVLAGLVADNRTIINRIYHLERGYELLEKIEKLQSTY